jgi:hypothetical protein
MVFRVALREGSADISSLLRESLPSVIGRPETALCNISGRRKVIPSKVKSRLQMNFYVFRGT